MKNAVKLGCFSAMLCIDSPIWAQNFDWGVTGDLGAQYETNANKASDSPDEVGDTRYRLAAGAQGYNLSRTTLLDFRYLANLDTWQDGTYDDRTTLQGHGEFNWKPVDFYSLFLRNKRYDTILNSQETDNQDNRSVRSTTEAGMTFTARLTPVDTLNLAPLYRAVHYQNAGGVDSQRPGILAFWEHRFSPNDQMTLNGFAEQANFDKDTVNDVNRGQLFAGYEARLNRLGYQLQFGYTWVQPEEQVEQEDQDYSGPLIRAFVDYDYQMHHFQFRAYRDLTDTSLGLSGSSVGGGDFNPGATNTQDLALVNLTQLALSYSLDFANSRWNWFIDYRFDMIDVVDEPEFSNTQDQNRNWVTSDLGYALTERVAAELSGSYWNIEYTGDDDGRVDEYFNLGLRFVFRLFRYGFFDLGLAREQRDSNSANASNYTNDKVYGNFRLVYPEQPRRFRGLSRDIGGGYGGF